MQTTKDKAPHRLGPGEASVPKSGKAQDNYHTKGRDAQQIPAPGTCLTAYLRKYQRELLTTPPSHRRDQLLNAVLTLLSEADR